MSPDRKKSSGNKRSSVGGSGGGENKPQRKGSGSGSQIGGPKGDSSDKNRNIKNSEFDNNNNDGPGARSVTKKDLLTQMVSQTKEHRKQIR